MKSFAAVVAAMAVMLFAEPSAHAQNRFKDCAAQWNAMKAANQTEGKNYREFQKGCLSKSSELAKEAGADDVVPAKPGKKRSAKAKTKTSIPSDAKKSSPARAAAATRRHECSAEWKADKAAGKIAGGMKWPQYYSACNARKKGAAASLRAATRRAEL